MQEVEQLAQAMSNVEGNLRVATEAMKNFGTVAHNAMPSSFLWKIQRVERNRAKKARRKLKGKK